MDFQSALETFAEAWVAASTPTPLTTDTQKPGIRDGLLAMVPWDVPVTTGSPRATADVGMAASDSLDVRCHVEITCAGPSPAHPEITTSRVSIPSTSLFCKVIQTVLVTLGYPAQDAMVANGFLEIDNWKPVPLQSVSDSVTATVKEIMGQVINVATLKISIIRTRQNIWTAENVRLTVVELLKSMPQSLLSKMSPLTQPMLSNLVNRKYNISEERCQQFGVWYTEYIKQKDTTLARTDAPGLRMTFDPKNELPLLRSWYSIHRCPTDEILQQYATELNGRPVRHERQKVTLEKIKNWWKNERQRERKQRLSGGKAQRKKLPEHGQSEPLQPPKRECPMLGADSCDEMAESIELRESAAMLGSSGTAERGQFRVDEGRSALLSSPEMPCSLSQFMSSPPFPFLGIDHRGGNTHCDKSK